MIFPTLKERNRVFSTIENYETFKELKPEDQLLIDCMYDCLRAVENTADNYEEGTPELEAIQDAFEMVASSIAEMYVAITDNEEYWEKE